jgi:hypothetical protein
MTAVTLALLTTGAALPARVLGEAEAAAFREEMLARFGVGGARAAFLRDEAHYLDQRDMAACSFAGLLQLLHVGGRLGCLDALLPAGRPPSRRWTYWSTTGSNR